MVNDKIVELIQNTADSFTTSTGANYKAMYSGYSVVIYNEFTYQFKETTNKVIEAVVKFGSAQKNNDIEDKFSMSFAVNIFSEPNGWEIAMSLFTDIFEVLTRTYQTLGNYKGKIFFTSPVLMNEQVEIGNVFYSYLTMNGSVEFSKKVVLGAEYKLSCDNGTNYITVKPRQPYCIKECVGAMDQTSNSPTIEAFSKKGNQLTINMVLVFELDGGDTETAHDTLFKKLYDECFGNTNYKYNFQDITGGITKTISNLICVRGQKIFDETTGENVLSLQFKVGA